jgi:MoxR-like ATPase
VSEIKTKHQQNMNFESRINLQDLNEAITAIQAQIGKVIVGQQQTIELLLTALLADGHVLIEGVPGVAKTLTAKLLARTVATNFSRIQFTPDLMPSDVLGTTVFNPQKIDFEFKQGPIFSNIVLVDEINRAPAKTQAALFEVMEERQITIDGTTYQMEPPFMILATQNPIEQEGTYRLPEAQLDRFLFKVVVGYPDLNQEIDILKGHNERVDMVTAIDQIEAVLQPQQLVLLRQKARQVHVESNLLVYIAQIVQQTRNNKSVFLGASPRASVALLNASKALSAIRGRDFVTPEDIRELAAPILRHRIILTPEREMEGTTPDDIVAQMLQKIEVPR